MKRTALALVAAAFALAAGSSFAQAPAQPTTHSKAKSAKHTTAHKSSTHAKVAHKSSGTHVAHKKSSKTPMA